MGTCRHEESLYGRCTACGMTWDEQARARELGTARRVKFHEARRHFAQGGSVLVSEHGYDEISVRRDTTVHSAETITWAELADLVREWRHRYPNQRFYIVEYVAHAHEWVDGFQRDCPACKSLPFAGSLR